jgi:hypothetical protein
VKKEFEKSRTGGRLGTRPMDIVYKLDEISDDKR